MASKQLGKIVRGVVGKGGTVYNDKLANGTRSIKVEKYGWTNKDYDAVQTALEAEGYTVTRQLNKYNEVRLHVTVV